MSTGVTEADAARLQAWWEACRASPGALPDGVRPVQSRLIRAVGFGELAGGGGAYLKVMGFPRPRDRVRYAARPLPGLHEARMLGAAAAAGIPAAEVLLARGERRRGLPAVSFLATRAVPVVSEPPPAAAVAAISAQMAAAGLYAPDLHPGNFLHAGEGRIVVIDLQSARLRKRPLPARLRVDMAAKLLTERPDCADELVRTGLVSEAGLAQAVAAAREVRSAALRRRIRRCLQESTEFTVERTLGGTTVRRRHASLDGEWIEGGSELIQYWIGERVLEVVDRRKPKLLALFRKSWWLPAAHSAKIRVSKGIGTHDIEVPELLDGFERFQALLRGGWGEAIVDRTNRVS